MEKAKNVIVALFFARIAYNLYSVGILKSISNLKKSLFRFVLKAADKLPNRPVSAELLKVKTELNKKFETGKSMNQLPEHSMNRQEVIAVLKDYKQMDEFDLLTGKISGTVYHSDDKEREELILKTIEMFIDSNPLHPDLFIACRQMEADVIRMTIELYNGGPECKGSVTSGGTESILLACKSYRDRALDLFGIDQPEIVMPKSAHAAFNKAGHYFGIKVIEVELKDWKTDLKAMKKAITRNTILLVASVPSFPYGTCDDIIELSKMTNDRIGLHVDCCLGSFIVPFVHKIKPFPAFDFRVKGVTSISCDTHKFGFAPKGTSVLMYSSEDIRKYQYYVQANWLGGLYVTPAMGGSRSGAVIAGCFAAMLYTGKEGYYEAAKQVLTNAQYIADEIAKLDDLELIGNDFVMVVAFTSKLDMYKLNDHMTKLGYNLNAMYNNCLHIGVTMLTEPKQFIQDLKACLKKVKNNVKVDGMAAIYGMGAVMEGTGVTEDLAVSFLDSLYQ